MSHSGNFPRSTVPQANANGVYYNKTLFCKKRKLRQVQTGSACLWHSSLSARRDWQKFPSRQLVGSGCGLCGWGGSGSLSRYTADSWAGHGGGSRNKRLCTRCRSGKTRNKDNGYFDEKPSSRGEILTKTEAVLIFVCEAADWKWKLCLFMKSEGLIPTLRICEWDKTDRNKRVVSFSVTDNTRKKCVCVYVCVCVCARFSISSRWLTGEEMDGTNKATDRFQICYSGTRTCHDWKFHL